MGSQSVLVAAENYLRFDGNEFMNLNSESYQLNISESVCASLHRFRERTNGYLGMLAAGAFVGGLLTLGLDLIQGWATYQKVITFVLSAAFSGVVFNFIGYAGGQKVGNGLFMYPVGLLLALMWFQVPAATANIRGTEGVLHLLGWGHLIALVVITLIAAALVLPPAFREAQRNSVAIAPLHTKARK